jgi:type III secretion system YopN/LcrE/InvE/MxiC family regulator
MASINSNRETILTQVATNNAASPVGVEVMAKQVGRAQGMGETVTVSSNNSDMTSALEEIGMVKATLGKLDMSKMKVRKGQGDDLEALSRIADFYDKLPNMPSEQKNADLVQKFEIFIDFFEELEKTGNKGGGGTMPTAEDIRAALREYDQDVTHQFAALENARAKFEAAGAPAGFLALLDEVRTEMRQPETAQEIKAGFASAQEAMRVADRFGATPEEFRESYRQMLRSGGNLGKLFDSLGDFASSGVKGSKHAFEAVLESFIKVAGDDMKSFGPSTDKAILGDVIAELNVLKNLRTTLDMCGDMMDKLGRMFPDKAADLPPSAQIVSEFLHFIASSARRDAEKIISHFEGGKPEVPVVAINILRDIHARVPDSAMPNDSARLQQDKVLKAVSDQKVAAEEAHYGG